MAARSRSVGRYDLVVEVAKSQLGPLWAAAGPGAGGLEPRLVRCLAVGSSAAARATSALADISRWSSGFLTEQAMSTLDVVSEGGSLALVASYVEGETLRSLLRLANVKREPISPRIALAVALDVCKAFAAAEARAAHTSLEPECLWGGLLPDSILVGRDGTARVLDLGVAALWRQTCSGSQHPEVLAYSAPEHLERKRPSANADVFTLGILLWEMLSGGKRLFAAASQPAVADKLRKLRVPPVVGTDLSSGAVDPATRALLSKMLEPDPTSRLSSMRELQQALEGMEHSIAPPHELADFVSRFAEHALDSRERALGRALQRGLVREAQRPASEPPPPPVLTPPLTPVTKPANAETQGLAAKPLPLPAQAKLGGRLAGLEGRWPPPPPPLRPLADVDTGATDDDDAGSVRAEDILAALAVDDLEPVLQPVPVPAPATVPATAPLPDAEERAVASAPISSGRRAPLTAVVVPSVLAGPDAPTFTPVPSVLQTLRGPGVPPLGSEALAFAATETPPAADAADAAVPASAGLLEVPSAEPARRAQPRTLTTKVEHAVQGVARGARRRLPVSLVAAVGGTAALLLLALAALGGGGPQPTTEHASRVLAKQSANLEQPAAVALQTAADKRAPAPDPTARVSPSKPVAGDTPSLVNASAAADPAAVTATSDSTATASLTAAAVATPRAAAPRPPRRVSAAARPTSASAKRKKIRATRTYIPSGI